MVPLFSRRAHVARILEEVALLPFHIAFRIGVGFLERPGGSEVLIGCWDEGALKREPRAQEPRGGTGGAPWGLGA